jgi:hypothetical protein
MKCKKIQLHIDSVSVNDLHLHKLYMPYIWLYTLTHTTLVLGSKLVTRSQKDYFGKGL